MNKCDFSLILFGELLEQHGRHVHTVSSGVYQAVIARFVQTEILVDERTDALEAGGEDRDDVGW